MSLKTELRQARGRSLAQSLWDRIRRALWPWRKREKLRMREVETERLLLREFRSEDIADISRWEIATRDETESRAAAQEFLDFCFHEYRTQGIGPWAIMLKETAAVVGNCGFPHIDFARRTGEINCYVAPQYRRRGLATEAIKKLLKLGFEDFAFVRIQARCTTDNKASERMMRNAGMIFEGTIPPTACSREPGPEEQLFTISL